MTDLLGYTLQRAVEKHHLREWAYDSDRSEYLIVVRQGDGTDYTFRFDRSQTEAFCHGLLAAS